MRNLCDKVLLHQCDMLAAEVWKLRTRALMDGTTSPAVRARVEGTLRAVYEELKLLSATESGTADLRRASDATDGTRYMGGD